MKTMIKYFLWGVYCIVSAMIVNHVWVTFDSGAIHMTAQHYVGIMNGAMCMGLVTMIENYSKGKQI